MKCDICKDEMLEHEEMFSIYMTGLKMMFVCFDCLKSVVDFIKKSKSNCAK